MHSGSRTVLAVAAILIAAPAANAANYNWDALGAEFCRLTLAGDLPGMRDILSDELARDITAASGNPELPPARTLFQSYVNEVPVCEAHTRSAAIVAVTRGMPGGAPPAWTEYLVIVPAADGTSRIDDVLFATRRSDTLRARLRQYAGG